MTIIMGLVDVTSGVRDKGPQPGESPQGAGQGSRELCCFLLSQSHSPKP